MSEYTLLLIHEQQLQRICKEKHLWIFLFSTSLQLKAFRMSNIIDHCTLREKIENMHVVRSHVGKTRQTLDHMQPFELQPPIKYSSLEINLQKDTDIEQYRVSVSQAPRLATVLCLVLSFECTCYICAFLLNSLEVTCLCYYCKYSSMYFLKEKVSEVLIIFQLFILCLFIVFSST